MGTIKLATASGGSCVLSPTNTASDVTLTVPAQTATLATLTTPSFASTIGVGGATAAASGAGITFPATQSASSDANTLDDYEEGTWTPQLLSDGGSAAGKTYSNQAGYYTKIGNICYFSFFVQFSNKGSSNVNEANLAGLPFTVAPVLGGQGGQITQWGGTGATATWFGLNFKQNNTSSYITTTSSAVADSGYYLSTSYTNTTYFRGFGWYQV